MRRTLPTRQRRNTFIGSNPILSWFTVLTLPLVLFRLFLPPPPIHRLCSTIRNPCLPPTRPRTATLFICINNQVTSQYRRRLPATVYTIGPTSTSRPLLRLLTWVFPWLQTTSMSPIAPTASARTPLDPLLRRLLATKLESLRQRMVLRLHWLPRASSTSKMRLGRLCL